MNALMRLITQIQKRYDDLNSKEPHSSRFIYCTKKHIRRMKLELKEFCEFQGYDYYTICKKYNFYKI